MSFPLITDLDYKSEGVLNQTFIHWPLRKALLVASGI